MAQIRRILAAVDFSLQQRRWPLPRRVALAAFAADSVPQGEVVPVHHVGAGPAAETICAAATAWQADLIVMGPRGRSCLAATLLADAMRLVQQNPEHAGREERRESARASPYILPSSAATLRT